MKKVMVEMFLELGVAQDFRMMFAQIFPRRHQKATRAACPITNHILCRWRCQLNHEANDVPRRAELAVLPGAGNLAEHIYSYRSPLVSRPSIGT